MKEMSNIVDHLTCSDSLLADLILLRSALRLQSQCCQDESRERSLALLKDVERNIQVKSIIQQNESSVATLPQ